jgi:hypothetical protein
VQSQTPDEKLRCYAVGLGVAGVLLALAAPMLAGKIYVNPDLGDFFLPLKYFYAKSLASGDGFLWCPGLFNGFYLHGEGQLGLFHPYNLLAYRWLPLIWAFNLEVWLRYPLLLLGFYKLLRRQDLPRDAAGLGAAMFAFGGFNLLHFLHLNAVTIIAHIPWLLLAQDTLARSRNRRKRAWAGVAVALLTTSQLLFGYPQYIFFTGLLELFYWLLVWPADKTRLLWWLGWKTAGVLGGGVQLLPTWESLQLSVRAAPGPEFQFSWSLPPANLANLVSPYLFQNRYFAAAEGNLHEFGVYAGGATVALAAWAVARGRETIAPRTVKLLVALALLAFVMSLGGYGYLYRLQAALPFVGAFRNSCRYLLLAHFGLSWLASLGYADLTNKQENRRGFAALACIAGAALLITRIGAGVWAGQSAPPRVLFFSLLPVLLFAGLAWLAARGWRVALLVLPLLACADVGYYGLSYVWQHPPQTLAARRSRIPLPEKGLPANAKVAGLLNEALLRDWRTTDGYAALWPRRELDYQATMERRLAGAGLVGVSDKSKQPEEFKSWLELPAPLPRVRLLANAQVSASPAADLANIRPEDTALVEEALSLPAGEPGRAEMAAAQNGRLVVDTETVAPRLLVVNENFHPGWQAEIAGQTAQVIRVYGDFVGIVVPSGRHRVELNFRPQSLRRGWQVTAAGALLLLILFGFGWRQGRRAGA